MDREDPVVSVSHDALPAGVVRAHDRITIANEFTGVTVRKVQTRNGERLEITVPKSGRQILLDAMQLEIVAGQDPDRFSELFRRQLGAE